jgi:hypothetical protein
LIEKRVWREIKVNKKINETERRQKAARKGKKLNLIIK